MKNSTELKEQDFAAENAGLKVTAKTESLTQKRLKELLSYDPITGLFKWRSESKGRPKGKTAGCIKKTKATSYIVIGIDYVLYRAHRLACLYVTGEMPKVIIDHKDGDGTNNAWLNLTDSTYTQNSQNTSISKRNSSGFTGVAWRPDICKWRARMQLNGKELTLGVFDTIIDAVAARMSANKKHGFSVRHGEARPDNKMKTIRI